jgi:hypothetical protein
MIGAPAEDAATDEGGTTGRYIGALR